MVTHVRVRTHTRTDSMRRKSPGTGKIQSVTVPVQTTERFPPQAKINKQQSEGYDPPNRYFKVERATHAQACSRNDHSGILGCNAGSVARSVE